MLNIPNILTQSVRWNSVFFSAIPVASYQVSLLTRDFQLDTKSWDATYISDSQYWITQGANHTGARDSDSLQKMASESLLERLNQSACIRRYLQTDVRHKSVLLVASNVSMSDRLSLVPSNIESSLLYRFESITTGQRWESDINWLCSAFWGPTFPFGPVKHRVSILRALPYPFHANLQL